jgi:hypothetical protein
VASSCELLSLLPSTGKCEDFLRDSTGIGGNRTVLWTNWILSNATEALAFLHCLDSHKILQGPNVIPRGMTPHQARARVVGSHMTALMDRLNMLHHSQLLEDRLQIVESAGLPGQDCIAIKCLTEHVFRIKADIVPRSVRLGLAVPEGSP